MKRCPKCETEKPLADFAKKKSTKDGLQCWCRLCSAKGRAAWVAADPERAREAGSRWSKENPERNRARAAEWKSGNPDHVKARDAKYRAENAARFALAGAAWRAANAERIRAKKAQYAQENAEQIRERRRQWKRANAPKVLADVSLRKYRKRRATPPWLTKEDRDKIAYFYRAAHALNMLLGEPHHVDHIVPLNGENVCGLHVPWNLQVLPAKLNILKSNKLTLASV